MEKDDSQIHFCMTELQVVYLLWANARIGNKNADVNTQDWDDDAEEGDRWEFADKLDTNEDTDKHEEAQNGSIHSVVVVSVHPNVEWTKERHCWRYVLLWDSRKQQNSK